jgi:hypothetical protein
MNLLDLLIGRRPCVADPDFPFSRTLGRTPHVTMLMLNRLPRRQGTEMIAYVTGGKALPTR